MSDSVQPQRRQPTRPCDSPGKNTGVGCHFLLQCMKVKSESEVAQSCLTLVTPWTMLLRPWDFPGRSTGVGCHCLLRKLGQSCGKQYGAFSKKLRIGLPYDPTVPLRGIYLQKTQSSAFKRLINQSKQTKEGTEMIPCKLLMLFTYFCISVIFFLLIKNTYIVI